MSVTGIIAEFNPLHKGHEYLIKKAKENGSVICVLSGNFVQRGETAIADKRIRTKAALSCSADLVLELPVLWSMSTAQNFALGSVSALVFAGCDKILFGSECGDINLLYDTADKLSCNSFNAYLAEELKKGITFAAARQRAAEKLGINGEILKGANNNLGIEYILAAKELYSNISFGTVARLGAEHDSLCEDEFVSASLLRKKLLEGDYGFCRKYMPYGISELFAPEEISDMSRIERAVLAVLRTKSAEELSTLPDISEGVENKLFSAIKVATTLDGLYNEIKVKRYTHARIRRLCLSAFIDADNEFFKKPLPYLRVLGFNKTGEKLLRETVSKSPVPIITRTSDIKRLPNSAKKVFETESRATDLFSLSLKNPKPCGTEYTAKITKI